MQTNIIQVGNSKGIILPANLLKRLRLSTKDLVDIHLEGDRIVIKASPRQGWEAAAEAMHAAGDDQLILPDVFPDEDIERMAEWK